MGSGGSIGHWDNLDLDVQVGAVQKGFPVLLDSMQY